MINKQIFENVPSSERTLAIQRLTALWALNECGLGGFLHALQSPFTGLLVGSLAMICIAFICALAENKWQTVMTSLVIVLVIKALVSPHSTPTAYIAVIFQGVTGAIIYRNIPPQLIWIIDKARKESEHLRFFNRWKSFILHTFLYILQYKSHHDPDPDRPDSKS